MYSIKARELPDKSDPVAVGAQGVLIQMPDNGLVLRTNVWCSCVEPQDGCHYWLAYSAREIPSALLRNNVAVLLDPHSPRRTALSLVNGSCIIFQRTRASDDEM